MRFFNGEVLWPWFCLFGLIFCLQIFPNLLENSPTDDEPIELTNGFFYWSGDVVTHDYHPPLPKALAAVPLKFLSLNRSVPLGMRETQLRAYSFFFQLNRDQFERMVLLGRLASLLFGLGIGLLLFWKVQQDSAIVLLGVMILWVFEPTILAYSGVALADIPVTFFFFSAVLAFEYYLENPGPWRGFRAGALAAAAVCCKFSALVLVPLFVLLQIFQCFQKDNPEPSFRVKGWIAGLAGFGACLCLIYLPGTLLEPKHSPPWAYFWNGLMDMAHYSDFHHPTYFLGLASRQNHWLYFPVTFALKTTLPFFIMILCTAGWTLAWKSRVESWIWAAPLLIFLSILPVQNLGVRYLLPAYPFLIIWVVRWMGQVWAWTTVDGRAPQRIALAGLLAWHAASSLTNEPNMISYFNDLIPQERKIYFLGDSNLDMGQDLKRLAETAREKHWGPVRLAQFGGAIDPRVYGMDWDYWTQKDLTGPQPGQVYAVNLFLLQLGPLFLPSLKPIAQSWVMSTPPSGRVGDTWIYFEIPGVPQPDSSSRINSVSVF